MTTSIDYSDERKNKEVNDSIIYARRIQEAMMLKEKHLHRLFPNSFILYKPKDIVSGDFYWFTKIEHKIIIVAADSTGHGVPGAFMSVLGINLLNQIVIEEKNTDVSFILKRLNHKLKKLFDYSDHFVEENVDAEYRVQDGYDIAICCIDYKEFTLTFAGAMSPLFFVSNNILFVIPGSRNSICGTKMETERTYEKYTEKFEKGDQIYLFSDGFADQFGGLKNKKFLRKNFKSLLLENSSLCMQEQQVVLEKTFNEWKKFEEQTDDVLVIGIQL